MPVPVPMPCRAACLANYNYEVRCSKHIPIGGKGKVVWLSSSFFSKSRQHQWVNNFIFLNQKMSYFFRVSSLAYPNLLGKKRLYCCCKSEDVSLIFCLVEIEDKSHPRIHLFVILPRAYRGGGKVARKAVTGCHKKDELCPPKFVNCDMPSNHILKLKPQFIAGTYSRKSL